MRRSLLSAVLIVIACFSWGRADAQRDERAVREQSIKYQRLMQMIDAVYVDTVNLGKLTEDAIIKVLADLDPHSVYISREEVEEANEPLEGGFFGIGIQFNILRDTLMVVDVVPGGPAEKVGMMAGDRIVAIDGQNVAGVGLTNTEVRKRLKGEKGTRVNVGVLRGNERFDFNIIRDKIPIHSVDAAYMIDKNIGYIKIARFAATTVEEFEEAVKKLQAQGMKDLIIDLQGNGGGYMGAAIGIADHLLDGRKLIVYTDGQATGRMDEYSTPAGLFQNGRVAVLLDGNSASASEIVSGAVQDWDRGLIVGRRSFGKGLVQRQFPLTDGSMVRLTVSHYYTPSGRCIQKPYKGKDYRAELYERYNSGELVNADSIQVTDSTKYYTKERHRLVYGGGGIIPDLFVPIDTGINYSYFNHLIAKNVINDFILNYVDKNRASLKKQYPQFEDFRKNFCVTEAMINEIVANGEKQGVKKDQKLLTPVIPEMKQFIKALIARDLWDMNELYMITNEDNKALNAAVKALHDGTYDKLMK
ncbi:S41 family peptidase [Gabonibacter massiliensis]|uniref:S41 family peptidase n=1 Tax=Gabonibacter massiliensis TaxID=1720195 RepID=UPI00073F7A77|nr:S41 family peptidase [Gabonibacter massiliensis]